MGYIENPKTRGSGIMCAIPQEGTCPNRCEDCFFQSGKSYLEPLEENLPNIPTLKMVAGRILRVNDGNDSSVGMNLVMDAVKRFPDKFYNTALPKRLAQFDAPVVLTLNPGEMTDEDFHRVNSIPKNLMFVRIRTNMWNLENVVRPAVEYYGDREVPIVLTFMAYYNKRPKFELLHEFGSTITNGEYYVLRKRTLNSYYAITTDGWKRVMDEFRLNKWVWSCGKIEGEKGVSGCRYCGNCLREYFATKERIRGLKPPFEEA